MNNMSTYRFLTEWTITLAFNTDAEAFEYGNSLVDDGSIVPVEKYIKGQWAVWDSRYQEWIR